LPMPNREFRACKPLVMMRLTTKLERLWDESRVSEG
jgi:hypothetical protein